ILFTLLSFSCFRSAGRVVCHSTTCIQRLLLHVHSSESTLIWFESLNTPKKSKNDDSQIDPFPWEWLYSLIYFALLFGLAFLVIQYFQLSWLQILLIVVIASIL